MTPTGNTYDKYGSGNPIERRLMAGFLSALDRAVPTDPGQRILEVGVGEGEVAARLASSRRSSSLVGLDLPDQRRHQDWATHEITGLFADASRLPFPDAAFDTVLAIEVLEHVAEPDDVLAEMVRTATSRIVVSVPHEPIWRVLNLMRGKYVRDLGNTPGHVQHWTRSGFRQLVERHLDDVVVSRPFPWTMIAGRPRRTGR